MGAAATKMWAVSGKQQQLWGLCHLITYHTVIEVSTHDTIIFFAHVSITSFANIIRYVLKYLLTFSGL